MPRFNLQKCGDTLTKNIKSAKWFPVKTGKLRDEATSGNMIDSNTYLIKFDSSIADYIIYLEEGKYQRKNAAFISSVTSMRANAARGFGVPFRQEAVDKAMFKSGKHMGFISNKAINYIIDYIVKKYDGELR